MQSLITIANETDLNLTVTSSTGLHRNGGSASTEESILVDLSDWQKVDLVDRRNRVCRIEPGVTYGQLTAVLAEHGMTLPMPLAPRDGKSVVASVMDREPTTWPNKQWDASDPVGSTEFIFGNGHRFRTGAAGGPGTIEQQRRSGGAQKFSSGPSQTDFHRIVQGAQGTMGILTWITVRCELMPSAQKTLLASHEELEDLLPFIYDVQRAMLGEHALILDRAALAMLFADGSHDEFERLRLGLPNFIYLQNLAGFERLPQERLSYHLSDIRALAQQDGMRLTERVGAITAADLLKRVTQPSGPVDWRDRLRGASISIFFLTTLDRAPAFREQFQNMVAGHDMADADYGTYIQPIVQNHACQVEFIVPFDPASADQIRRVKKLEEEAVHELLKNGAFFSRPYGTAAEGVWAQNPANYQLLKTIKGIFDPNRVLQREKWGLRERRQVSKDMAGSPEALKTILGDIVGEQWVSTAPCVLDTYAYYQNPETMNKDGAQWLPRPAAVVLPKSTAEVQEIMRFCCRSDYMVKPLSTGFHTAAAASNNRVIVLDLKRMNRILEVDVKNQIAVIEPYVRAIDLQTEIVKHGLNCHIISSGANHSLLASHAAAWGYGVSGAATSFSGRNLLGLEWVLPSGDVVTLGSAGSGCGWFSPDGPGPSMRGIVRGFQGTFGGLGVFTKCAIKLYKWDGPRQWDFEGQSPKYMLKKVPERCALNAIAFPSRQAEKDAGYKMGEAELNHGEFRTPMFFAALGLTESNEELKVALESGIFQKIGGNILSTAVFAASEAEFSWKMKALRQILKETGGVIIPMNVPLRPGLLRIAGKLTRPVKDPLALLRRFPVLQDWIPRLPFGRRLLREKRSTLFWLLFRNANNTQAAFRPSQGMATMMGAFDTWDLAHTQAEYVAEVKQKYIREGLILDDGGDLGTGGTFESGHLGYLEGIILYDPGNPQSTIAAGELVRTGVADTIDRAMGLPIAGFGTEANALFGPACHNYHLWLQQIKSALDPHTACDPFFYAEARQTGARDHASAKTAQGGTAKK